MQSNYQIIDLRKFSKMKNCCQHLDKTTYLSKVQGKPDEKLYCIATKVVKLAKMFFELMIVADYSK